MPISYEKGDAEVQQIVREVMAAHHPCLTLAEARIGTLMARTPGDEGEPAPAVKFAGYPALAVVKVLPLKQRVLGNPDALITIDEREWELLDDTERRALIDHELEHLQVKRFGGGGVLYYDEVAETVLGVPASDDIGRPKLTCKLHDWQLGGFRSVAQRWKQAALEVQAARACQDQHGQYYWDFGVPATASQDQPAPRRRDQDGDTGRRTIAAQLDEAPGSDPERAGTVTLEVYVSPEQRRARQETAKLVQRIAENKLTGKEHLATLQQLHDLIPHGPDASITLGEGEHECTLTAEHKQRLAAAIAARQNGGQAA